MEKKCCIALVSTAAFWLCAPQSPATPEEYAAEETPTVSAQELNLIYGSLPHKKDENFSVLAKTGAGTESGLPKYYLLHRHSFGKTRAYLVVKVDTKGLYLVDERFDNPFRSGNVPSFQKPVPMPVAAALYRQCFGLTE